MVWARQGGLPDYGVDRLALRVDKAQAVLLYHLLEGCEGMTSFSTLSISSPSQSFRDVELVFSHTQRDAVESFLSTCKDWLYRLPETR